MEKLFRLSERKTNVRTEVLAGITTFLTMAYIIVVNPQLLSQAGMSFAGVLFATILVCALSSIFMGLYANLPYGLAPGMSINAFFTFTLVLSMDIPWQTALGAVFVSGIIFIILSVTKVRTIIVKAVPVSLRYAVAAGIGLFLTLIGLTSIGFIVTDETTTVSFGGLNVGIVLFVIGLLLTSVLLVKKVRGALILGIIGTSILAAVVSLVGVASGFLAAPIVSMPKGIFALPSLEVFFKLDLRASAGVICNAGFELISECLQWGKPVLTRPLAGQMEQRSTAEALRQLGYATVLGKLLTMVGSENQHSLVEKPGPGDFVQEASDAAVELSHAGSVPRPPGPHTIGVGLLRPGDPLQVVVYGLVLPFG